MTNTTPTIGSTPPPVSINDSLPTSSPSAKATLIGLGCIVVFITIVTLVVIYYQTHL
jgi:hypothetical protein